jgi:hypothetical protein
MLPTESQKNKQEDTRKQAHVLCLSASTEKTMGTEDNGISPVFTG